MTVNSEPMKIAIASATTNWYEPTWTIKVFHDSERAFDSISKNLDLMNFFQLSWEDVGNNSVLISCNVDCAAIVVAWEHSCRQDSIISLLTDQDWLLKTEQEVSWIGNDWPIEYGKSKAILSKGIAGGTNLTFSRPSNNLPISVFVVQGKKNCLILDC